MPKPSECPVCLSKHCQPPSTAKGGEGWLVNCEVCGEFIVTEVAWEDYLDPRRADASWWTPIRRAALSHALKRRFDIPFPRHERHKYLMLTSEALGAFVAGDTQLPTPREQGKNIIKVVGDLVREGGGEAAEALPIGFYALIGAPSPSAANKLVLSLEKEGLLEAVDVSDFEGAAVMDVAPTMAGWEVWESQQAGTAPSSYGIVAMKFGDPALDTLVQDILKPAVDDLGLKLHRIDDPEIVKAGIIDNVMRDAIRRAAFLIADLSHANNGAYWEAGFAEGLGKPVIYLCEQSKWEAERTHFDTNHCTTLIWNTKDLAQLARQLTATLQNSLGFR